MLSCYGGMFERNTSSYSDGGIGSFFHKHHHHHHGLSSSTSRDSRLPPLSNNSINSGDSSKFVNVPVVATRSTKVETNKALVAKSHKEAERRRRERINGHLSTLRTLLPNTNKTDKASLLAEVVKRVKELKKLAAGITKSNNNGVTANRVGGTGTGGGGGGEDYWAFPSDTDEIALEYCYCKIDDKDDDEDEDEDEDAIREPESSPKKKKLKKTKTNSNSNKKMIKATFSCEDRSDLLQDLTKAIRSVRGKVMKAEMATIGGRTKGILVIRPPAPPAGGGGGGAQEGGNGNGNGGGGGGEEIVVVRRALKSVVDKGTRNASNQGFYSANQNKRFRHHYQ